MIEENNLPHAFFGFIHGDTHTHTHTHTHAHTHTCVCAATSRVKTQTSAWQNNSQAFFQTRSEAVANVRWMMETFKESYLSLH